jgi:hypothetical protein
MKAAIRQLITDVKDRLDIKIIVGILIAIADVPYGMVTGNVPMFTAIATLAGALIAGTTITDAKLDYDADHKEKQCV